MDSAQSPALNDLERALKTALDHYEGDAAPTVPKAPPTAEEAPSAGHSSDLNASRDSSGQRVTAAPARSDLAARLAELNAGRDSSDQRFRATPDLSEFAAGLRAVKPSIERPGERPSMLRRTFRALTRFLIAALIGVGAAFAWQFYGDEAKKMIRPWAHEARQMIAPWVPLWVSSSVLTTKSLPDGGAAEQAGSTPAIQAPAQAAAAPQSATAIHAPASADIATSPALVQQLETMGRDLAGLKRSLEQLTASVEQLAAKQDQVAANIAAMRAAEQDIREKISSSLLSRPVPVPRRKPAPGAAPPLPSPVRSSSVPPKPSPGPSPGAPLPLR